MKPIRLASSTVLLAALLVPPVIAKSRPLSYVVRAPAASQRLLEAAAETCGYAARVRTEPDQNLTTMVVIDVPDRQDPQFRCLWKWISDNGHKGLAVTRD